MIESEEIQTNRVLIRKAILNEVFQSRRKLTPQELEKRLSQKLSASKSVIQETVRQLVENRELIYSYHYGCSFLEKSFNRPIRISDRVVLKPPDTQYKPEGNEVVIDILPGASFGIGEHPTTRLAIRGIEQALSRSEFSHNPKNQTALDIGTGSGVLAIVLALMGGFRVLAVDIDPCALAEAKANARLNNLEQQIEICDRNVENIAQEFALITANLRYPTLKRLGSHLAEITATGGAVVVSGVKSDEVADLVEHYNQHNFQCIWQAHDLDWAGLVFERTS